MTLATRAWGRRGDPAVVCWPGLSVHAHAHWDEAGPLLAERFGLRVAAVEPPGWGSPSLAAEAYRPRALAGLVVPLLGDGAAFVGWSWGGSIGVHLGALGPPALRALVLLDAGYTDLQDDPDFEDRSLDEVVAAYRRQRFRFDSWEAYLHAVRPRVREWRPGLEARARAGMREEGGAVVPVVEPEPVAAAWRGVAVERPSGALPQIRVPVLLVAASETIDRVGAGPLERFRTAVPHAEIETLECGHDLVADALDETVALVGSFLGRDRNGHGR